MSSNGLNHLGVCPVYHIENQTKLTDSQGRRYGSGRPTTWIETRAATSWATYGTSFYILTTGTGSQSWWRLPTWSRNVDKQYVVFGCIRVINIDVHNVSISHRSTDLSSLEKGHSDSLTGSKADGYRISDTDSSPWARIENVENLHHKIYDLLGTDDKWAHCNRSHNTKLLSKFSDKYMTNNHIKW